MCSMSAREERPARVRPGDRVRLSRPQEKLWLLDQVGDERMPTNVPLAFRVRGPLDLAALRGAAAAVRLRHDVLRTRYAMTADGPVQWVTDDADLDWSEVDSGGARERVVADVLARFDLTSDDPFRVRVHRVAPDEHLLVLVTHHIVADARGDEVLVRDLASHYRHATLGEPVDLPDLPVQYLDHAVRENATAAAGAEHWRASLAGASLVRPPGARSPGGRGTGRTHDVDLPEDLAQAVVELARTMRASPFMVLLAAFRVALWRAWHRSDVVIGTPMSGRSAPDVQDLVGNFLVMAPLRTDPRPGATFRDLAAAERATVLDAYANHRTVPEAAALFSVTFSYESAALPVPDLGSHLRVEADSLGGVLVQYDLMVKVVGRRVEWAYDDHVLDGAAVAVWAETFTDVLARVVADPGCALADLAGVVVEPAPQPFEVTWVREIEPEREWTAVERIVVGLWEELIGTRPLRASDSFFELGGHSLAAARLAFRLTEELGVPVAVAHLLDNTRLGEQAALVESLLRAELQQVRVIN